MAKASRSQFLQKLHHLLENPIDPDGLRWVSDDSFEVSSKDAVAIHALSPAFQFHSLSSFIASPFFTRQLSYYTFRRLSDRRRSTERRSSNTGYIVFTHPSGFFVRGDSSKLNKIIRRARARPETGRRTSLCSIGGSDDGTRIPALPPPPPAPSTTFSLPHWTPSDFYPRFDDERRARPSLAQLPPMLSTLHPPAYPARTDPYPPRRSDAPTSTLVDPNRDTDSATERYRRASLGDLGSMSSSLTQTPYTSSLPSLSECAPLRWAASSVCAQTTSSLNPQAQQQPLQEVGVGGLHRSSPYPPPTFPPPTHAFYTYPSPPPAQQRPYLTYAEPSHFSSSSYEPIAPPPPYQPHTSLPSPAASAASANHSPPPTASGVPTPLAMVPMEQQPHHLDPRHLVDGKFESPHHLDDYSYASSRPRLVPDDHDEATDGPQRSSYPHPSHPHSHSHSHFKPPLPLPPMQYLASSSATSTTTRNSWSSPAPLRCTAGY
ncbi:hypothetical protein JCM1840_001426 [Sporobolomyces johnsonii]